MDIPNDVLLANAILFLMDEQETDAAALLLLSSIESISLYEEDMGQSYYWITLRGPKKVYDSLKRSTSYLLNNLAYDAVESAFNAVFPPDSYVKGIGVRLELITDISPNWREELMALLHGSGINNQGTNTEITVHHWSSLRFYSKTEIKIAEALERAGALFLPNCLARLGSQQHRINREVDFIVCHHGKWGAIEVDGAPFHPAERSSLEAEKDRLLKAHGIKVVERFDAKRCYANPDEVVKQFLYLLTNS